MTARIAKPLAHASIEMRAPVERNDARLVYRLVINCHGPGPLHDLITIAVVRRNTGQRIADDAPRADFHVLWTVVGPVVARPLKTGLQLGLSFFALRCWGGHFPVRRIVNERRPAIR